MSNLSRLKIGFFGTPDFSLQFLKELYKEEAIISYVVSQPPSRSGRGKFEKESPVSVWAKNNGIKCFTPENIANKEFQKAIGKKEIDFIVVVAFGKIVDEFVLNLPRFLPINVHVSLLPRWRGAAPIQRALLEGDKETGVCIMKVEKALDSGPIISKKKIQIQEIDTAGSIFEKATAHGSRLLIESLKSIADKNFKLTQQNHEKATYAKKIKKEETKINWKDDAESISLKIRAFCPKPGAWTTIKGTTKRLKIFKAQIIKDKDVFEKTKTCGFVAQPLMVKCGKDFLKIIKLQPEGKKILSANDFINGLKENIFYFE